MITTEELKNKYLNFFKSHNHAIISGSSLIPENDPTVLFTTAGMHPLVPYLMGESHPAGKCLTNNQPCIRTGDIDEVGDNTHLTFFEMLGNWSLGDYFKKEAIEYSWEFLTSQSWLGLDKNKLAISVFAGDKDSPQDNESATIWKKLGISEKRIVFLPKKNNWWGPAGQTGPCGPDTEMFYWIGEGFPSQQSNPKNDENNWMEIWNDVFMQYYKNIEGEYLPAKQKNVDTGMGVERTVAALNGFKDVYEVDSLKPIYDKVSSLAKDKKNKKALRVITDHLRAAVMIMGDDKGVEPSNVDQGYVVRRLIRQSINKGKELGIEKSFITQVADVVIEILGKNNKNLGENRQKIISDLTVEEEKYKKAIQAGIKETQELIAKKKSVSSDNISGKEAFNLYSTHGVPIEIVKELAKEKGFSLDENEFNIEVKKHQSLSREGSQEKFKGGLADHSYEVKKLHTATHLLQEALRQVLGDHVAQKGSNITKERLRFDFSHPTKLTNEEIKRVEDLVNEQIKNNLPMWQTEMTVEEAKKSGALGLFGQKYGEKVKVYTAGEEGNFFSRELCGGPHVENTGELGLFKIKKEQASSAGVRRIKAILQ